MYLSMISFLFFFNFVFITGIILLVIIQRSAESSVLVSSPHFAPGGANKLLVKITRVMVCLFIGNCLLISCIKYNHGISNEINKVENAVKIPFDTMTKGNNFAQDLANKQIPTD